MNKITEFIYVKDLPDVGGLRACRMQKLRLDLLALKIRGAHGAVTSIDHSNGQVIVTPLPGFQSEMSQIIEIYYFSNDLESQLQENRALNFKT